LQNSRNMPPALRRVRQEDCEFEASLDYTVRTCLKKQREYNHIYGLPVSFFATEHVR
jgi:hypothetical protein